MKTTLSALAVTSALLGTLACGQKEARPEAKALPRVAVSLASTSTPEGGAWVAATLQSTRTAMMSTRMAAQVKRVYVEEGQRVAAGTLLLSLNDQDLQGQLKAAETGLATLETQRHRIVALQAEHAATQAERDQIEAQVAQAQAGVTALKANIAYTQIRAPFSGVVQSRKVNEGDFVGPGMPLLEIYADGEQELVASVSARESQGLKVGQTLEFTTDGTQDGEARITALAPGGDPWSHKGTLRARVVKPKGLRQGSFARILIPGLASETLTVPESALVKRGELTGVFVAKNGQAELRWISVGDAVNGVVPVRAGLLPTEQVIDHPGALLDGQPIQVSGGVNHGN